MKFTKPFYGVPDGEIYPVRYAKGDECPPELEAAALEAGAVAKPKGKDGKPEKNDQKPPADPTQGSFPDVDAPGVDPQKEEAPEKESEAEHDQP